MIKLPRVIFLLKTYSPSDSIHKLNTLFVNVIDIERNNLRECDNLNTNVPQRLIFQCIGNSIWSTIVAVGWSFGGSVWHWRKALGFQMLKPCLVSSLFLLPVNLDVELLASSPAPWMLVCHHTSHHGDNKLNLWTCKPAPIIFFLYKSCCGHAVYLQQQ